MSEQKRRAHRRSPSSARQKPKRRAATSRRPARRPRVWYEKGLQFTCTRCGTCCRDREVPTYVFMEEEDILRLADHLGLPAAEFIDQYCDRDRDGYVLRNKPGACVFWEAEIGCVVYPARPIQCRTWPFWPTNLRKENWEQSADFCPGCNRGTLFTREEIEFACRQMLGGRGDGALWPGEIPLPD